MNHTPPGKLLPLALQLVRNNTLDDVCRATGLPNSWVRKFRQQEIKSPCVQRVELLITKMGHTITVAK